MGSLLGLCWFLLFPRLSASERLSFVVCLTSESAGSEYECCARHCALAGGSEVTEGSCPPGAHSPVMEGEGWEQEKDVQGTGESPERRDQDWGAREGLSKEVMCSFQQSVTVPGTPHIAVNRTGETSTFMELNSCWGASGKRDNRSNTN